MSLEYYFRYNVKLRCLQLIIFYRKAYTMKEMKTIVEYLTEHKAYSEIKGRKMWKDLADSKVVM